MSQKRIDNRFQEGLENYFSSVDEEKLWSEIEDRIPKKKKRRILIWFFFGLSLMMATIAVVWSEFNNSKHIVDSSQNKSTVDLLTTENEVEKNNILYANANQITAEEEVKNQNNNSRNFKTSIASSHSTSSLIVNNTIEGYVFKEISDTDLVTLNNNEITSPEYRNQIEEIEYLYIPAISFLTSSLPKQKLKGPRLTKKKPRRPKPKKKVRTSIGFNYFAGTSFLNVDLSTQDDRYIDFGKAYFSQGISFTYDRYLFSNFYGKIICSVDQTLKKYTDNIERDTLVPSSLGKQILSYSQYSNGTIDTESGIPIVSGVFSRDVVSLNAITSVSIGLGIGYTQKIGNVNFNIEGDVQRSIYFNIEGLGREGSVERIENLEDFQDYFSLTPKYFINTHLSSEFQLANALSIVGGVQYQFGKSSLLLDQTGHAEKINLLRLNLGLKKSI